MDGDKFDNRRAGRETGDYFIIFWLSVNVLRSWNYEGENYTTCHRDAEQF